MSVPQGVERVDENPDGTLDDVAISIGGGMFRIEQMSKHSWWLCLYRPDGQRTFVVRLSSKSRIHAIHEWQESLP